MNKFVFDLQRFDGEKVCKIGTTEYETFSAALTAATDNATIQVISDFTLVSGDEIKKNITLDLNGHAISTGYTDFYVGSQYPKSSPTVTITDTSQEKNGKITGDHLNNYGTLTISGGIIDVEIENRKNLTITGGTFNKDISNYGGTTISISGGNFGFDFGNYESGLLAENCFAKKNKGTWTVSTATNGKIENLADGDTFIVGGKNYKLTGKKIFLIEGDNPTKYLPAEKLTWSNNNYSVNISDLNEENFVTCPYVKPSANVFTVNSTEEKYFFSSDNKLLATCKFDINSQEYKISPSSDSDLSEYTFEIGEIFNKNNTDAKNFYFDRTSLKANTHTTIKTTAGKFFINWKNFSAKTPLEIVVHKTLGDCQLKTAGETTLSVSNGEFYLYKDDNSNPKSLSVSVNSKNSAEVDVTFKDKEITKITGLDAGEIVNIDVRENGDGTDVTARNFYYFNGENLLVGEYEKSGDTWQIKDDTLKIYSGYSSEKNVLDTENLTEATAKINFVKVGIEHDYQNDIHTATIDLTNLGKNTIFYSADNDSFTVAGNFIDGEINFLGNYKNFTKKIQNLPEGQTVKFEGVTYRNVGI